MLDIVVGVLLFSVGVCLVGNFWGLASRVLDHASVLVDAGGATVNTFRLVGVVAMIVGLFWVATALPEIL
ncbi:MULTISPECIES: hypothetical protein [unclassified Streptomyces]|uniref:hypothetical protein n=1 Tax=unclassified Streptomyces TaxID=2593676 RepID=UPI00331DC5E3